MNTHTWFSPFGDRNQAPTHMAAMMNRPMKMLHLGNAASAHVDLSLVVPYLCMGMDLSLPVSHFEGSGGLARGNDGSELDSDGLDG